MNLMQYDEVISIYFPARGYRGDYCFIHYTNWDY